MPDASESAALEAVLESLRTDMPELGDRTCAEIFTTLSSYADVEPAALRGATERNLQIALTALHENRVPKPSELHGAEQTATERFHAGVTIDQVLLAFRVSISQIHARFVDTALAMQVPAAQVVDGSRLLWGVSDSFTARAVTTYRALEVSKSLADAERTMQLVDDLLAGRGREAASLAGMDLTLPHLVFVGHAPSGLDAEKLRLELLSSSTRPHANALVALRQGRIIGIAPVRPAAVPDLMIGVGPLVPLASLDESRRIAELAAISQPTLGGVFGLEELGWRLAAVDHPELTRHFVSLYVDPVQPDTPYGAELLKAMDAWATHARSIPRSAAALYVHPNTLRYRIQHYRELTGIDLDDLDQLFGLRWALHSLRLS